MESVAVITFPLRQVFDIWFELGLIYNVILVPGLNDKNLLSPSTLNVHCGLHIPVQPASTCYKQIYTLGKTGVHARLGPCTTHMRIGLHVMSLWLPW